VVNLVLPHAGGEAFNALLNSFPMDSVCGDDDPLCPAHRRPDPGYAQAAFLFLDLALGGDNAGIDEDAPSFALALNVERDHLRTPAHLWASQSYALKAVHQLKHLLHAGDVLLRDLLNGQTWRAKDAIGIGAKSHHLVRTCTIRGNTNNPVPRSLLERSHHECTRKAAAGKAATRCGGDCLHPHAGLKHRAWEAEDVCKRDGHPIYYAQR